MIDNKIILIKPIPELKEQALIFRQEFFDNNEDIINGSELFDKIFSYEEWLKKVTANSVTETVDPNWVLTDTFFAVRTDDRKIIGIIDLRYELNDFLLNFGHCGYSVRPSELQKGYATEMLKIICGIAKKSELKELQLSVEKDNIASVKTIIKNDGIYDRSFKYNDKVVDIYKINLIKF